MKRERGALLTCDAPRGENQRQENTHTHTHVKEHLKRLCADERVHQMRHIDAMNGLHSLVVGMEKIPRERALA